MTLLGIVTLTALAVFMARFVINKIHRIIFSDPEHYL